MKKMIKSISTIFLSIIMLFGATSCIKTEDLFIEDGDFIYYNLKNTYMKEDCYAIVGSTEQGKEYKEDVYVPAYFKGKEVTRTSFTEYGAYGGVKSYALTVNCKNLYFFNTQESDMTFVGKVEYVFVPASSKIMSYHMETLALYTIARTVYVSNITYNYIKEYTSVLAKAEEWGEINEFTYRRQVKGNDKIQYTITIINANTTYLFNYENAPNEGIFFINNYVNGELIENTPYEPIRKGYRFVGWYKEPKCVNAWDFETDTLPEVQYDEQGKEVYQETKLYAKWIKE